MTDANTPLMQKIRSAWGDAIVLACAASSVPPSFLAALIANESGGNAGAHRGTIRVPTHSSGPALLVQYSETAQLVVAQSRSSLFQATGLKRIALYAPGGGGVLVHFSKPLAF